MKNNAKRNRDEMIEQMTSKSKTVKILPDQFQQAYNKPVRVDKLFFVKRNRFPRTEF